MAGRALVGVTTGMLLAAFGSSLGAGGAHAQAAPTLKVDPSSGRVGITVLIAGRGFCGSPACSSVQISFAGIVVADGIRVGSDAGFALSVAVPGGIPPGEKPVSATQTTATGKPRAAITTFQVTLGAPATASPTSTATPTATGSVTIPASPGTTVIGSPAAGGGGSSEGLLWAMVVAAGVFLAALVGMATVLWRSRAVPPLPPPPVGPIAPYDEVVAALTPHHHHPEGEARPLPSPGPPEPPEPPEPSGPPEGSGEGQTTG